MMKIKTNGTICAICCEDNFSTSFFHWRRGAATDISQQLVKTVKLDKLPYSTHGVKVEVDVVHRVQHRRQDLIRHEKVPKVRPGIGLTDRACAGVVDRRGIFLVPGILDNDMPILCEQGSVTGMTSRHHAVEHVDAQSHAFNQVLRRTHSHQIAWPVLRKKWLQTFDYFIHHWRRFAHCQTAD